MNDIEFRRLAKGTEVWIRFAGEVFEACCMDAPSNGQVAVRCAPTTLCGPGGRSRTLLVRAEEVYGSERTAHLDNLTQLDEMGRASVRRLQEMESTGSEEPGRKGMWPAPVKDRLRILSAFVSRSRVG